MNPVVSTSDVFLSNLHLINRVLWLVILGVGVFVTYDYMEGTEELNARLQTLQGSALPIQSATDVQPMVLQSRVEDLSTYVKTVKDRNPFTGARLVEDKVQQVVEVEEEVDLAAMAEGLVVVGLDRGLNPEALVEDSKNQRTHFLKPGDKIREFTVQEIDVQGIVLDYEGQTYVLQ